MIYLTGALDEKKIGERKDIGVMFGYRSDGNVWGKSKHFDKCLWAIDNGAYTQKDVSPGDYLSWIGTLTKNRETNLFAVAMDVVGDAQETWKLSKPMLPKIRELGFAAAFVAQDGIADQHIEWDAFDCLFIGGTTEFKLSDDAFWLTREAAKKGKWTHWGRVNSMRRILQARFAGANSVDGTHLRFEPTKNYKNVCKWLDFIERQPVLMF